MKIHEVEKIVGITKKNIRFYENVGLLSPNRNKENGYRDYGDEDIKCLEQIKFLRKLGVPLEEIRFMQDGRSTVADAMRRHLVTLERNQQNITHSIEFCNNLKSEEKLLCDLDAQKLLLDMEQMEGKGAAFHNVQTRDVKPIRYVGAFLAASTMIALMLVLCFIIVISFNVPDGPPVIVMILLLLIPITITVGILHSLMQRIGEIKKGEIDDAKRF